jgi:hypothetical protein
MKVKLNLFLLAQIESEPMVLLDNKTPLETTVGKDPLTSLQKLTEKYLILNADWVNYRLLDFYKDGQTCYVVYTARVPDIIEKKIGRWVAIGDIDDEQTQKLVYKATLIR